MKKLLTAIMLLAATPALAQQVPGLMYNELAPTVTTTAAQCVPQDLARKALTISNPNASTVITFCVAGRNSFCTPSVNAAGSYTLIAGQTIVWQSGSAPLNALWCVGSASGNMSAISGD